MGFSADVGLLSLSAVSIAFFHTMLGPDHYVPFVAMAHVGKWSMRKTILVTLLCGFGHVGSSVALGLVGVAAGILVMRLETLEAARGDLAGWALLGFGVAYAAWGVCLAVTHRSHGHSHAHAHSSADRGEVAAIRAIDHRPEPSERELGRMTPWILAVVFILGPCEPLIPLLMYPAARANLWAVGWISAVFGFVTLLTMTSIVVLMKFGVQLARVERLHPYGHALAGFAVLASGLAIKLGL
ncbi:MAG: hypothetical protein FJ297_03975 [Planctomycetes bacterium]|nr:hypothetical protein [Planctomycetota bacterium]